MARDRWKRIETLDHAALEKAPAERSDFLAAACGDDAALRAEVESLLGHHSAEGFPGEPPRMSPGAHLGHYEILTTRESFTGT